MTMRIMPVNWIDEVDDLAVTPAAVSTMPITNVQATSREDVYRSPNLDPQTITGTFGGEGRPVNAFAIAGALMGANVRLELFPSTDCSGAASYDSGAVAYFTYGGDGWGAFDWGGPPWGVDEDDRTAALAIKVLHFAEVVAGSWRITLTNRGAMATPYFEVRRIWLAQSILAPYNAQFGLAPGYADESEHQRSPSSVLRVLERPTYRVQSFEVVFDNEADRAAWSDILAIVGKSREVILQQFPAEDTRRSRDTTICGRISVLNPITWANVDFNTLQLSLVES